MSEFHEIARRRLVDFVAVRLKARARAREGPPCVLPWGSGGKEAAEPRADGMGGAGNGSPGPNDASRAAPR